MFLGHIGEHAIEAVDEVTPGANFGWSEREGPFVFDKAPANPCDRLYPLPADDAKYGYTYPVAAYDHDPPPDWNCTLRRRARDRRRLRLPRPQRARAARQVRLRRPRDRAHLLHRTPTRCAAAGRAAPIYELMLYDEAGQPREHEGVHERRRHGRPDRVDLRFGRDADGELYLLSKGNGKVWRITGTRRFASCDAGAHARRRRDGARGLGAGHARRSGGSPATR